MKISVNKNSIFVFGLLAGFTLSSPKDVSAQKKANKKPNFVLVMADDLGYSDLGCYGGEKSIRQTLIA